MKDYISSHTSKYLRAVRIVLHNIMPCTLNTLQRKHIEIPDNTPDA